ncbi:uncharacterized protein [Medicago truncatula]|nr:uncharacterized protein LOC25480269 [Medicago truncatula]
MFVLNQKLKNLKEALKVWNKNIFGNVHSQVDNAYKELDDIQVKIHSLGYSNVLMDQEKAAQLNLESALNIEEVFSHEKSKVKWHCEGDRNTAFFHIVAKIKRTSSLISTMKNGEITLTDPNLISEHVVNHFTNIFTNNPNITQTGMIEEVITNLITERINNMLTMLPSYEEISNAVFSLNSDSAPWLDGFGAIFFKITGK